MSKYDDIESAFRERFDNDISSEDAWNTPRDQVWSKIEKDLSKEEKSRYGLPFFILLAGLILSLLGIGYVINQNNRLSNKVKHIEAELKHCNSNNQKKLANNNIAPEQNIKEKNGSIIINTLPKVKDISTTEPYNIKSKNLSKSIEKYNQATTSYIPAKPQKSTFKGIETFLLEGNRIEVNTKSNLDLKSQNQEKTFSGVQSIIAEDETLPLGSKFIFPISTKERIRYPSFPKTITPQNSVQSFVTISGGVAASNLIKNGKQVSALTEIIDKEYARLGATLNLSYTAKISKKYSFTTGLSMNDQEFITEYDLTLPYNIDEEVITNGVGHIDFEHSLPTSFGNTNTELRLRRSDAEVPLVDSDVDIDFNTKHRFVTLGLPFSIDYLASELQSGFYIGLDVVPSYIVLATSGIASVVAHHDAIESVNNTSESNYAELSKFNLGLGGHFGYRYSLSQKSGLSFNASYLRNLNSYFSSASFTSRSQGIQLSAGYYFRF